MDRTLVKLLGSFIVKRSPSVREMIYESNKLSAYIHSCICEQRVCVDSPAGGTRQDADDRTQTALLKILPCLEMGAY